MVGKGRWTACLLQILFFPLFVADERQRTVGAFSNMQCLNNYGSPGRRVDCTWHRDEILGEAQFYLNFSDIFSINSDLICNLSASVDAQDHFSCSVYSEQGEFTENDQYVVSLHVTSLGKDLAYPVFQGYMPRLHIGCDPPFGLQSNMSSSKCRIQWKKSEAHEEIGIEEWQYELAVKTAAAPWEQAQTKRFAAKETWVEIEGSEFKSTTDYVARMRCRTSPKVHHYKSHWSPWSKATEWKTPPGEWQQWLDSPLRRAALISLPLSLGPLLFLLLALRFFWRLRSDGGMKIPSPATFFQPLYTSHDGDFKRWVGHAETGAWLRSSTEDSGGSKRGGENAALALSQISFKECPEEAAAKASQKRMCPLPGAPACPYVASKEATLEVEQKVLPRGCRCEAEPPRPLSGRGSLQQKGPPPLPCKDCSFLARDSCEAKILSCTHDYCTLGGGGGQQGSLSPELCRVPEPSCC